MNNKKKLTLWLAVPLSLCLLFFVLFLFNDQATTGGQEEAQQHQNLQKATFAGGCFWCMEPPFEKLDGVRSVVSGFMGGTMKNPSYKQVAHGETQHREVVQVAYNPDQVGYRKLLSVYWRQIDPTDDGGQFVDRGRQYTTAIFYHSKQQKKLAEQSKERLQSSGIFSEDVVTPILEATSFYRAEEYHQDFYKKSTKRYKSYRNGSGRDEFLKKAWSGHESFEFFPEYARAGPFWNNHKPYTKPPEDELRKQLTSMQYNVTQEDATEPAYDNAYWNEKREGIYVDVVSGEPLFSSTHKFKSGTGWPSFYKALEKENIVRKKDHSFFSTRIEVRSKHADSHLGHVFEDGPEPTGLRYCINSAALEFIPANKLEERGYGKYTPPFR